MTTYWEKKSAGTTYYLQILDGMIIEAGSHRGSGHTDNAGTCTIEEFLDGTFKDIVRNNMGEDIINEIIHTLENISSHRKSYI